MSDRFTTIELEKKDRLALIKLKRPPLNIINLQMIEELQKSLDSIKEDDNLCLLVIKSGIEKVFSAGADVKEHLPDKVEELIGKFERLVSTILYFPKPTLCIVDGICLGGGMELAMACDLVIASEDSELGQPEIKVGVFPPIATSLYPRIANLRQVSMLIFTGKRIRAEEALTYGFLNEVVSRDKLEEKTNEIVNRILENSSVVLMHAKKAMLNSLEHGLLSSIRRSSQIYLEELMKTEDAVEGLKAFLEKRIPIWKNK